MRRLRRSGCSHSPTMKPRASSRRRSGYIVLELTGMMSPVIVEMRSMSAYPCSGPSLKRWSVSNGRMVVVFTGPRKMAEPNTASRCFGPSAFDAAEGRAAILFLIFIDLTLYERILQRRGPHVKGESAEQVQWNVRRPALSRRRSIGVPAAPTESAGFPDARERPPHSVLEADSPLGRLEGRARSSSPPLHQRAGLSV